MENLYPDSTAVILGVGSYKRYLPYIPQNHAQRIPQNVPMLEVVGSWFHGDRDTAFNLTAGI